MNEPVSFSHAAPSAFITAIQASETKGARPASVRLACPVKLLKKSRLDKTPCPFGGIVKHTHLSVMFAFDYAANVNRQREREGVEEGFTAKESWFAHVSPAIVAHKQTGELYAFARMLSPLALPVFTDETGAAVDRVAVVPFLPVDDLTADERAAASLPPVAFNDHQGIEKEVKPFTVRASNIRELVLDGARLAA